MGRNVDAYSRVKSKKKGGVDVRLSPYALLKTRIGSFSRLNSTAYLHRSWFGSIVESGAFASVQVFFRG
jgi:hypothetical protein